MSGSVTRPSSGIESVPKVSCFNLDAVLATQVVIVNPVSVWFQDDRSCRNSGSLEINLDILANQVTIDKLSGLPVSSGNVVSQLGVEHAFQGWLGKIGSNGDDLSLVVRVGSSDTNVVFVFTYRSDILCPRIPLSNSPVSVGIVSSVIN